MGHPVAATGSPGASLRGLLMSRLANLDVASAVGSLSASSLLSDMRAVAGLAGLGLLLILFCVLLSNRQRNRRPEHRRPPFGWTVVAEECVAEFLVGGRWGETVEKRGDFGRVDVVIPVNGKVQMKAGRIHRWALVMERLNRERPEVQLGIQGLDFEYPWRLVTTTRCSRSRDEDEMWTPRPGGNKTIHERDVVHLELDLRRSPGSFFMAVNDEPSELLFADIPIQRPVMPAVMLGGHGSRVRVQAASRRLGQEFDAAKGR